MNREGKVARTRDVRAMMLVCRYRLSMTLWCIMQASIMAGKLILIFGPSGSGKGELIAHIRNTFPDIIFARSETSRAMRPGERADGLYHFLTREAFDAQVTQGDFLEWAEFGGNQYGTLKSEILPCLEQGKLVLKEVEIQGLEQIRRIIPKEQLETIFIDAGTWEDMEVRIRARAPISEEELAKRKMRYEEEIAYSVNADHVVHNLQGKLADAQQQIETIIRTLA